MQAASTLSAFSSILLSTKACWYKLVWLLNNEFTHSTHCAQQHERTQRVSKHSPHVACFPQLTTITYIVLEFHFTHVPEHVVLPVLLLPLSRHLGRAQDDGTPLLGLIDEAQQLQVEVGVGSGGGGRECEQAVLDVWHKQTTSKLHRHTSLESSNSSGLVNSGWNLGSSSAPAARMAATESCAQSGETAPKHSEHVSAILHHHKGRKGEAGTVSLTGVSGSKQESSIAILSVCTWVMRLSMSLELASMLLITGPNTILSKRPTGARSPLTMPRLMQAHSEATVLNCSPQHLCVSVSGHHAVRVGAVTQAVVPPES